MPSRLVCRAAGFRFGTIHHWGSDINTRPSIQNSIDTVNIQQNAWSDTSGKIAIVIICFLRLIYVASFSRTMINILNILKGTWMGLLSASGSLARVSGPLFVGWIYREYGTYWTMGLPLLGLVVGLVLMIYAYKRLIPYVQRISEQQTNSVSADNNRL